MPLVISVAVSAVNKWSDKQKLRWKEDLKTHLIWLTSNAPPDVVSKWELTSFACSISEMHRSDLLVSWSYNWHLSIINIYVFIVRKIYSSNFISESMLSVDVCRLIQNIWISLRTEWKLPATQNDFSCYFRPAEGTVWKEKIFSQIWMVD